MMVTSEPAVDPSSGARVPGVKRASSWAKADPRVLPRGELVVLDSELVRRTRGTAALRLRLGEALDRLQRRGWHHSELGFPDIDAYYKEACVRQPGWGRASRALARRLEVLPLTRAAVLEGRLPWSKAEALAKLADAESEAELLAAAGDTTVRALRREAEARKTGARPGEGGGDGAGGERADVPEEEGEEAPPTVIEMSVPTHEAWAWEGMRRFLARTGAQTRSDQIEAALAEGLTLMMELEPELEPPHTLCDEGARRWREHLARRRAEAEEKADAWFVAPAPVFQILRGVTGEEDEAAPDEPLPLHRFIRRLAARLAERDLVLGRCARRFFAAAGWRRLGFENQSHYARERLGMTWRSVEKYMRLARDVEAHPEIGEAIADGRIGFEAGLLVGRSATRETAGDWVARAEARTVEHLREEVDAAETLTKLTGQRRWLKPPDDETIEAWHGLERAFLEGHTFDPEVADPRRPLAGVGGPDEAGEDPAKMSAVSDSKRLRPGAGTRRLRLVMDGYQATLWRWLKRVHERSGRPGSFIAFLCEAVYASWRPLAEEAGQCAWAHIFVRDRWVCLSPVCSRHDVTAHHLRYKSHGGGDEDSNLGSLCSADHLRGVHGGVLKAAPPAEHIVWEIGRTPIMVVRGRVKLWCDGV